MNFRAIEDHTNTNLLHFVMEDMDQSLCGRNLFTQPGDGKDVERQGDGYYPPQYNECERCKRIRERLERPGKREAKNELHNALLREFVSPDVLEKCRK